MAESRSVTTAPFWERLKSITLNAGATHPENLWPKGASSDYIAARRDLREAERALRDQLEEVARLRRALPPGVEMADYSFAEGPRDLEEDEPTRLTPLRELFGEHDTLVVYHMMFHPDDEEACPMCSMWVDGLHGVSHHIARHTSFAVIAKAPLPKLRDWAWQRGWYGLRIVSSYDNSFNSDLEVEGPTGGQWPAVSVFVRHSDGIRHFVTERAGYPEDDIGRGMDLLSPVWNVFDLLPHGRGDWLAENTYTGRER
jgi:predicted dithiol-disulfide oxidoreductase (DUF899 family)